MTSTRLKDSSSPFSLLRLADTDLILSCTASLLPTLPLRAPLQARPSSLLHLPLARALPARQAWPPPFLNVRIKVWQKNSLAVLPSSCLAPHPHPYPLAPGRARVPRLWTAGRPSKVPEARARSRSPAARRDRLPASPRLGTSAVSREEEGRPHPGRSASRPRRAGRAAESMCIQLTPRRAVAGCRGTVPDVSVWV